MQLIRRSAWGAPAVSPAGALPTARGTKVHWLGTTYSITAHSKCAAKVRQIRRAHLAHPTENWIDIAYNAAVCPHGYVFEGRGAGRRSGANGNWQLNSDHYAVVALHGTDTGEPGDLLLTGLADAIAWLNAEGGGDEVLGHRDGKATECPGDDLYAWVRAGAPRPGGAGDTYVVRAGDTLSAIARRYATTVPAIVAANGIEDPDVITVGQKLRLPAPSSPSRPVVDLSRLRAAAKADPPASGTPVSYSGVRPVEDALVAAGLLSRRYADGHFGTKTIAAYSLWQQQLGYRGTQPGQAADGIPGKDSLTRLGQDHGFDVKE